jgi:hypothetical protein
MKKESVSTKFKLRRILLLLALFLMLHSVASAVIVIGYIPVQGVDVTSTAWYDWIKTKAEPIYSGEIQYHEVENLESLNEMMNTYSMIEFAVLSETQLKEFRSLSDIVGPMTIGEGSKLFARPGVEDRIMAYLKANIHGGKKNPATETFLKPLSPQAKRDNANYVTGLYSEILRREPDLNGLTYWTDRLNSGALTREQVAGHIRNSNEARNR